MGGGRTAPSDKARVLQLASLQLPYAASHHAQRSAVLAQPEAALVLSCNSAASSAATSAALHPVAGADRPHASSLASAIADAGFRCRLLVHVGLFPSWLGAGTW